MNVLFHDNHLLIVEKEAGLLTQPTKECLDSLETRVKTWLQKELGKETVFLKVIHRLDKGVGGLVIFARSSKATERLNKMQQNRQIEKIYRAEVEGVMEQESGELTHFLQKQEYRAKVVRHPFPDAKECTLFFEVVERRSQSTLLDIRLVTGRYHQIRAQLGYISHPILGDAKYGAQTAQKKIHLTHFSLFFIHPVSKQEISIKLDEPGF